LSLSIAPRKKVKTPVAIDGEKSSGKGRESFSFDLKRLLCNCSAVKNASNTWNSGAVEKWRGEGEMPPSERGVIYQFNLFLCSKFPPAIVIDS
jgi:hypothetical protein